jgi:predicted nucleotidyltransferase
MGNLVYDRQYSDKEVPVDWSKPTEALIPGLEGVALRQLYLVDGPQTAGDVHERAGTGSRNGLRYALDRLADQGIVVRTTAGNTAIYELNREHLAYPALTAALGTYRPYPDLRDRLRDLVRDCPWDGPLFSLAVYGSVPRGQAGPDSDVDLLLVLPDSRDPDDPLVDDLSEVLHVQVKRWTGNRAHLDVRTERQVQVAAETRDPLFASWAQDADFVFGRDVVAEAKRAVG